MCPWLIWFVFEWGMNLKAVSLATDSHGQERTTLKVKGWMARMLNEIYTFVNHRVTENAE